MLRRLCGSALFSISTLAVLSTSGKAEAMQLLIPAYFDPGPLWTEMTAAAADGAKITAIMNPSSGPGTKVDSSYLAAVTAFEAAGGTVLGYVHTTAGKRSITAVETDIQNYESFYPVNGIFLDQMSDDTKSADLTYYSNLYSYIKGLNPAYEVVGNPGTSVGSQYESLADTLVTFEDVNSNYAGNVPSAWTTTASPNQTANIAYEVPDTATMLSDLVEAESQNVGYVYFTDDGADGNPYDSLPTYFSAEVSAVPEPAGIAVSGAAILLLRKRRGE